MALPACFRKDDSRRILPISESTSTNDSRLNTPLCAKYVEHAADDMMVRDHPSRYVDYLSHDWKEEDIWSSRKHLLSKPNTHSNLVRLESILWRIWTKSQHRLKTVPAESLNWLKDYDATWLYGPLQASPDKLSRIPASLAGIGKSESNSSANRKSILKKRSVLETIFQTPLYVSSLPHRAAAAVPVQSSDSISLPQISDTTNVNGVASGHGTPLFSLRPMKQDDSYELLSVNSWGEQPLGTNSRKHIHFNDNVEWWTMVDAADSGDDETRIESHAIDDDYNDSPSDDEFLTMKESPRSKSPYRTQNPLQASRSTESNTIASLPSTMLKDEEDNPKIVKLAAKEDGGWPLLSLPQQTLPESEMLTKMPLDNYDKNVDMLWKPSNAFATGEDISSASQDTLLLNNWHEMNRGEVHDDRRCTLFSQAVVAVNSAKDMVFFRWSAG